MATADRLALGRQIYDYFVARGIQPHQAAAIAGNMAWEGGGRTDLVNPGDNWRHSPNAPHSVGIAQWNDRSPALIAFARSQGIDIPEGDLRDPNYARDVIGRIPLQTQLDFAWSEMQGPERRALDAVRAGTDLNTAAAGAIGYHRPAGWTRANPYAGHGFAGRVSLANQILGGGEASSSMAPPPVSSPPPSTPPPAFSIASADTSGANAPSGSLFGSLFAGLGQPSEQGGLGQQDQNLVQAARARLAAEGDASADAPALTAPQMRQLDLTRLRALLQGRGRLGTLRG
jgi:hypothetical protein